MACRLPRGGLSMRTATSLLLAATLLVAVAPMSRADLSPLAGRAPEGANVIVAVDAAQMTRGTLATRLGWAPPAAGGSGAQPPAPRVDGPLPFMSGAQR